MPTLILVIGNKQANAISPKPPISGLCPRTVEARPSPSAVTNGTVTVDVVTRFKEEQDDTRFADLTRILFDQAVLSEGGQLDDPAEFVHNLNGLLQGLLK